MGNDLRAVYRASKKAQDINWFTQRICRPPAALVVYGLQYSRVTPNQVSLASLAVAAIAAALWAGAPSWGASIAAAAVFQLSFILDCADGGLARIRGQNSALGHLFDFHLDEIKALLIYAAVSWRVFLESGHLRDAAFAVGGLSVLGASLSLTSFTRRSEYGAARPTPEGPSVVVRRRPGLVGTWLYTVQWLARAIIHYPQHIWLFALFDRMDLFVYGYSGTVALYFLWTLAKVGRELGGFTVPLPSANEENAP